jgi:hypothetical protein
VGDNRADWLIRAAITIGQSQGLGNHGCLQPHELLLLNDKGDVVFAGIAGMVYGAQAKMVFAFF